MFNILVSFAVALEPEPHQNSTWSPIQVEMMRLRSVRNPERVGYGFVAGSGLFFFLYLHLKTQMNTENF
jgi:hypothetical protein